MQPGEPRDVLHDVVRQLDQPRVIAGRSRTAQLRPLGMLVLAGIIVVAWLKSDIIPGSAVAVAVAYAAFVAARALHGAAAPCIVEASAAGLRVACSHPVEFRPWTKPTDRTIPWEEIEEVIVEHSNWQGGRTIDVILEGPDLRVYLEAWMYDVGGQALGAQINAEVRARNARREIWPTPPAQN